MCCVTSEHAVLSFPCHLKTHHLLVPLQLREKASQAKSEAGGLAPLAHSVLEAQKEEQRRASELAALKRYSINQFTLSVFTTCHHVLCASHVSVSCVGPSMPRLSAANQGCCMSLCYL